MNNVDVGKSRLTIEDVLLVAQGKASLELSKNADFVQRIRRGADYLAHLLADEGVVYGVNTGYGDSCTVAVPPHLVADRRKDGSFEFRHGFWVRQVAGRRHDLGWKSRWNS